MMVVVHGQQYGQNEVVIMADISKINPNGTEYDLKDAYVRSLVPSNADPTSNKLATMADVGGGGGAFSFVGMIVESTNLATLADVQAIYGANTTWIQHTGYVLRGASSGVVANDANKTGGADSVSKTPSGSVSSSFSGDSKTLSHSGGAVQSHTLTESEMPKHKHTLKTYIGAAPTSGQAYHYGGSPSSLANASTNETGGGSGHTHGFTQPNSHTFTPSGSVSSSFTGSSMTIATLPNYKSVYIWERTA